jgi:rhodanese-related sulfurtransferase
MKKEVAILTVASIWIVVGLFAMAYGASEVTRITKEEVKAILGNPETTIIDVRTEKDWNASEFKIEGAVREDPNEVSTWMERYPKDKTLIFYCA